MRGIFARLCITCINRFSQVAVDMMYERVITFVATWCWNQTRVQEMRGNFVGLLKNIKWLIQTSGGSNPTVNQLLKEIENEASEGIELLDGEPTPSKLQDAMRKFERIRSITQDLKQLLERNINLPVVTIKPLQFKPQYLRRRTRFQVLMNCKVSSGVELLDGEPRIPLKLEKPMRRFGKIRTIKQDFNLTQLLKKNARESRMQLTNADPQVGKIKPPQFKPRYLFRRTRFHIIAS